MSKDVFIEIKVSGLDEARGDFEKTYHVNVESMKGVDVIDLTMARARYAIKDFYQPGWNTHDLVADQISSTLGTP